jgi:hypothetical protein
MSIKGLLPLVLGFALITGFNPKPKPIVRRAEAEYVYICKGPKSLVYHRSEDCRGLSHCSTQIYKVTLADAVRMGRRPCKIEYK